MGTGAIPKYPYPAGVVDGPLVDYDENLSTYLSGAYEPLQVADSFSIDSTDTNGNPLQTTEHFGSTVRVTVYTWNTDGTLATETVTVNGVAGATKTMSYSSGVLTGWS